MKSPEEMLEMGIYYTSPLVFIIMALLFSFVPAYITYPAMLILAAFGFLYKKAEYKHPFLFIAATFSASIISNAILQINPFVFVPLTLFIYCVLYVIQYKQYSDDIIAAAFFTAILSVLYIAPQGIVIVVASISIAVMATLATLAVTSIVQQSS